MPDFRIIPSIDELRQRSTVRALEARFGADATVDALRHAAAAIRTAIAGGDASLSSEAAVMTRIESAVAVELGDTFRPSLEPVINATGVIVHTNLGRAPLADAAIERVAAIARGYASLEYDLGHGARGRRDVHAEALLCRLTGAGAAAVVNNNAAATMIILAALAAGREVIVSRGELVEIGGGFRVPDVMAQSGAVLREVGTTNKTRASDYAAAISERTALILRVHPSNFRIEGFTARPALADLVAVGKKFNIPVAEDLGSGYLSLVSSPTSARLQPDFSPTSARLQPDFGHEPAVADSVAAGVDVCCFSGDKLLGGPQAGIIVGRPDLLTQLRTHPLMRALRVDKMTYAALEATLTEYVAGRAATTVPVQRMLTMTVDEIRARAETLASAIGRMRGWRAELVDGVSAVGGGSAPGVELPTCLVAIEKFGLTPDALEERLRRLTPPIIARIERDRLVLDLRTVLPDQDRQLAPLLDGV
ncbi:MAG: L-seryl-tRNA(Sec) selenium transferase [Acidobacteria bacterium 13_1_20CM_2_65_9]|nr:MAG: L-seryl-tRNA(Sec) selenium transferase [Acidobacteria bacterium 13_1_20CM_2_65_9]